MFGAGWWRSGVAGSAWVGTGGGSAGTVAADLGDAAAGAAVGAGVHAAPDLAGVAGAVPEHELAVRAPAQPRPGAVGERLGDRFDHPSGHSGAGRAGEAGHQLVVLHEDTGTKPGPPIPAAQPGGTRRRRGRRDQAPQSVAELDELVELPRTRPGNVGEAGRPARRIGPKVEQMIPARAA